MKTKITDTQGVDCAMGYTAEQQTAVEDQDEVESVVEMVVQKVAFGDIVTGIKLEGIGNPVPIDSAEPQTDGNVIQADNGDNPVNSAAEFLTEQTPQSSILANANPEDDGYSNSAEKQVSSEKKNDVISKDDDERLTAGCNPNEARSEIETVEELEAEGQRRNAQEDDDDSFKIRTISFHGNGKRIIMQSINGPCPLIAAINALVLKGLLTVPAPREGSPGITRKELTEMIGAQLLMRSENIQEESRGNYETTLADVLNILPGLGTGLEVNLRFRKIDSFEYTTSVSLFDLLNLNLYHTWVVEPSSEYYDAIGQMTYNEVVAKAFENNVLKDFLEDTSSQMTYTGLFDLRDTLREGELAVLFRNNHFHTLHKHEGEMFVLCTDEGFIHQPKVVWEVLRNIEGDSAWADAEFRILPQDASSPRIRPPSPSTVAQTDADFELARQLQNQMNLEAQRRPNVGQSQPQAPTAVPRPSSRTSARNGSREQSKKSSCTVM